MAKYVLTVCYDDNNVGYTTRTEHYESDDKDELERLYRYDKCFKKGCCGSSVRDLHGNFIFGYLYKQRFGA